MPKPKKRVHEVRMLFEEEKDNNFSWYPVKIIRQAIVDRLTFYGVLTVKSLTIKKLKEV